MVDGFQMLMPHDQKCKIILYPQPHDREYVTFEDDKRGRITGRGMIKVNERFVLKDIALVKHLRYNLLSVSQHLDDSLEVSFKPRVCRVLDSTGALVCGISRIGKVF